MFLETRARALQRQQQQQQQQKIKQNRLLQNRVLSSQGSGFVKLSGGTGVFHPRVSSANSNIAPTTTTTNAAFAKKKQGTIIFMGLLWMYFCMYDNVCHKVFKVLEHLKWIGGYSLVFFFFFECFGYVHGVLLSLFLVDLVLKFNLTKLYLTLIT